MLWVTNLPVKWENRQPIVSGGHHKPLVPITPFLSLSLVPNVHNGFAPQVRFK